MNQPMLKTPCPACQTLNQFARGKDPLQAKCGRCKADLFGKKPVEVTAGNFEEAIQGDVPTLVDFWAPWCGPCKMMGPVLDDVAAKLSGQVRILKLNTEEHPQPASSRGIRGIPTLILYRGGQELSRISGAMPESSLMAWLRPHLS